MYAEQWFRMRIAEVRCVTAVQKTVDHKKAIELAAKRVEKYARKMNEAVEETLVANPECSRAKEAEMRGVVDAAVAKAELDVIATWTATMQGRAARGLHKQFGRKNAFDVVANWDDGTIRVRATRWVMQPQDETLARDIVCAKCNVQPGEVMFM